ncbi:MAG: transcriptional regulator, MerR family [Rhizobium sp.]|nr:transcriptional regulator, MerR family [Rhizobium sp.]
MLAYSNSFKETLPTTETESAIARKAVERLEGFAKSHENITFFVEWSAVPLPAKAVHMMLAVLEAMAEGKALSVIPHEAELTTKQAADFLNVSRPFVCKLIDEGKLPARLVNRHRRVKFADLVAFEQASKADRSAALAELAELTRELGLE